ncbi:hypothetical protein Tco_0503475 [Tanacetum coccineum]
MENYKNVSQDIRNQLDAEAKAFQIILIGIDNDIYSIVDACLNACEMWKAIERGKEIVNSPSPTYDQEPDMVTKDDEMSKEKEIDKLMALISLSFKKIYKPTNNNLKTSSNTSRANQDNYPITNRGTGDGTDDKPKDQELEAHSLYMAHIQEVTLDAANNSGSIFDAEPLQKEHGDTNITTDSLDMSNNGREADHDEIKIFLENLLESSNKTLVDKLQGEIEDFKNKSLESSNNHFKEANKKLSKTNQLMFKDLKRFQAALNRYHDVNYASKVEIDCAKAKGDLIRVFVQPDSLKKAQRANPRLYDIGCYNDNLALMLAPNSDETIRLA